MLPYIAVSLGGSWGGWSRELDLRIMLVMMVMLMMMIMVMLVIMTMMVPMLGWVVS